MTTDMECLVVDRYCLRISRRSPYVRCWPLAVALAHSIPHFANSGQASHRHRAGSHFFRHDSHVPAGMCGRGGVNFVHYFQDPSSCYGNRVVIGCYYYSRSVYHCSLQSNSTVLLHQPRSLQIKKTEQRHRRHPSAIVHRSPAVDWTPCTKVPPCCWFVCVLTTYYCTIRVFYLHHCSPLRYDCICTIRRHYARNFTPKSIQDFLGDGATGLLASPPSHYSHLCYYHHHHHLQYPLLPYQTTLQLHSTPLHPSKQSGGARNRAAHQRALAL